MMSFFKNIPAMIALLIEIKKTVSAFNVWYAREKKMKMMAAALKEAREKHNVDLLERLFDPVRRE